MSTAPILYSPDGPEDLVLDPVEQAVADIAAGRPVVVVDDENRENEGDLVIAAEKATEEIVAFCCRCSPPQTVVTQRPAPSGRTATAGTTTSGPSAADWRARSTTNWARLCPRPPTTSSCTPPRPAGPPISTPPGTHCVRRWPSPAG